MTLEEIKVEHPNKRLVAVASKGNGLTLMAGSEVLPWPSDWPENITGALLEDSGFEILKQA